MSGLKNEPFEGSSFVNFKDGKLISNKEEFTHLIGLITEMDITDEEYKGKEYRKITLFVKDDEDKEWKLGFPLESGYGTAFCSLANNVDFSKPVLISGGTKDLDNGNSYGVIFIKQGFDPATGKGGKNLKWAFTKESAEVPDGEAILNKQGKQTGIDWSARNDFFHHFLLEKVRPRILNMSKAASVDEKMAGLGFKKTAEVKKK
jgi:hypothetical protein